MLLQLLKNPIEVLLMLFWGFAKNKDIIKVDYVVDIKILHRISFIMH